MMGSLFPETDRRIIEKSKGKRTLFSTALNGENKPFAQNKKLYDSYKKQAQEAAVKVSSQATKATTPSSSTSKKGSTKNTGGVGSAEPENTARSALVAAPKDSGKTLLGE